MTDQASEKFDHQVDVLVVGSGAGGMAAAITAHDLGAKTLLIEKSDLYGGSSAMSGGALWIPCNHLMRQAGIDDSREDALTYLREITGGAVEDARLEAYVDNGPEMLEYLMSKTRLRMIVMPEYPDYYPRTAGSRPGGRTVEAERFDARELGDDFDLLRPPALQELILGRISMTATEARDVLGRRPGWMALTTKIMGGYWIDVVGRLKGRRDRSLALGNALIAPLRLSLADRGVPLWLNAPAEELIVEDGRVVGAVVGRPTGALRVRADKAVIFASGGFESSAELRKRFLPNPTEAAWTCGSPSNTGDAVTLGQAVGAGLAVMDDAWWGPVTLVPGEDRARMLVIEKGLPGCIFVNKLGKRFVNEAAPYIDIVNAMYRANSPEAPCVPCYLVFDADYRKKYPCGPMLQASQQPDWALPSALRQGYLKKADTLGDLAAQLGVDAEGLAQTVAHFNDGARRGEDSDFERGETVFDRYYGDARHPRNPCLAPIEKPPFYGMVIYAGDLGTKGGLRTDERARVLTEGGETIPGLYAVGNCSASMMGPTYAGAGATIGPSMAFGYVAARDAVGTA